MAFSSCRLDSNNQKHNNHALPRQVQIDQWPKDSNANYIGPINTTSLQNQDHFIEPTHPPSDSDNPSWATLSVENTSSDEDALELESKATTPEPVEEKVIPSYTTTSHIEVAPSRLFLYQQPSSSPASHSISPLPTCKNQSSLLKRAPSPNSLSPHMSPTKKTKTPSLHESHHTLLDLHPLSTHQSEVAILPQESTTTWPAPPVHLLVSQRQRHTPFSSHRIHTASLLSPLTHQALRPRKPLLPITDGSSIEDWALVDDALHTQVASVHVLQRSAQFPAPWEPESAMDAKRAGGAHISLTQFADLEKGSKGKERARSGWTAPRWSNVGDFKARLDTMYGPGDINRGLGRGPKSVSVIPLDAGTVGKRITGGRWL